MANKESDNQIGWINKNGLHKIKIKSNLWSSKDNTKKSIYFIKEVL